MEIFLHMCSTFCAFLKIICRTIFQFLAYLWCTADVVKTSRSPIVWHFLQKQKYFNVLIVVVGQTFIIHSLQLIWKQNSYKQCTTLYWLKFWIFKKPHNHQRCRARAEKFHWISKKNFFEWDSRLIWKKVEIREKNTCIIFAVKLENGERETKRNIGLQFFWWLLKNIWHFLKKVFLIWNWRIK